ncbi:Ig-like domain-containing protein [Sandaracinus amylolyticus]|uniref:Ig-like domain-containing protein n=1 Tax=Sandaracinus amylolyticus TaxID=927083 RepID=UPI00069D8655|nr:Ig-like domain-containing protein [Sandaracinus amylolyticus]
MRNHAAAVALCALSILACGDDDAASTDAGAQAQDAGSDAGPPMRTPFCDPSAGAPGPYPAPDAFPAPRGPGVPAVTFEESALGAGCAFLDGGEWDVTDHHNLGVIYDGYLLMPIAPEFGGGGLAFFDLSDPCAPTRIGSGSSRQMRESHSIGFSSHGGRWAVVDGLRRALMRDAGGVQFWDVSDPTAPEAVSSLDLPGFLYPDAYARVTLSVFWQVPYVYVAGADNGVYVVDATNPRNPVLVRQVSFEPTLRAGHVQAIGNLLIVTAAEGPRTVLLDISDPEDPQPIPGGDFDALDENGRAREAYFTTATGGYVWYAKKEDGGGLMVMDIHDPTQPRYAGSYRSGGNGGYVFLHEHYAFVGESSVARIYDVSDLSNIRVVRELSLPGDLDTIVPLGNLALLSVDALPDGVDPNDQGSAIAPWRAEPDSNAPRVTWAWPQDGAEGLPPTSRFAVTFDEMIDVQSAWEGSVRLHRAGATPDEGRVAGVVSAQETIVTFSPFCPLERGEYVLEIPAGGVRDVSGNAVSEAFTATFRVGVP